MDNTSSTSTLSSNEIGLLDESKSDDDHFLSRNEEKLSESACHSNASIYTDLLKGLRIANADDPSKAASSVTSDVICFVCKKAMNTGICLIDRYCHPNCFRCVNCEERILLPHYGILQENLYCAKHFKKLLGKSPNFECDRRTVDYAAPKSLANEKVNNLATSSKNDSIRIGDVKWCASCHRTVQESIFQRGQFYHPDCVECATCKKVVGTSKFETDVDHVYCSKHGKFGNQPEQVPENRPASANSGRRGKQKRYNKHILSGVEEFNCKVCRGPLQVGVFRHGDYFHRSCFKCSECGKKCSPQVFTAAGSQIVCMRKTCSGSRSFALSELTSKKLISKSAESILNMNLLQSVEHHRTCSGCQLSVDEGFHVFGKNYHFTCFICSACGKTLRLNHFKMHDDGVFCPKDYKRLYFD
ncbi:hypothetical protein EG68_02585 [Paragonimus skrjabini miyazakii]|uniref:LIM zinc-binding domain-containing protein n=1 Tax=Paragonimus skrjabini miyazakii TaxID=59628 RepID=A0A8S9YZI9_9TREM|nr:hypothetical protein EG68_02585 [Paragonimus skrjabini miyazakii]